MIIIKGIQDELLNQHSEIQAKCEEYRETIETLKFEHKDEVETLKSDYRTMESKYELMIERQKNKYEIEKQQHLGIIDMKQYEIDKLLSENKVYRQDVITLKNQVKMLTEKVAKYECE